MKNTRTESNFFLAKLFKEMAEVITNVSKAIKPKFFSFSEYKYLCVFIYFNFSIISQRDDLFYTSKEGYHFSFFFFPSPSYLLFPQMDLVKHS